MRHGLFISFEGGEASGKSVQVQRLAESLERDGHDVVRTREPGGTPLAERVRDIVLHAQEVPLGAEAQVLLFSAARAANVRDVIRPALSLGKIVITDRFFDSTAVYQGAAQGLDPDQVAAVTAFAVGETRPVRTYLLDLSVESAFARRSGEAGRQWDRFEVGQREFHERLREAYLRLAAAEPDRILVVDGDREPDVIARDIRRDVDRLLSAVHP